MINNKPYCGWPFYRIAPSSTEDQSNDLLIIAECVASFYTNFYNDFIKGKNSDFICPKLDDNSQCVAKMTDLIKNTCIQKIIIVRMEQPCCGYLFNLVENALKKANKTIPVTEKIVNQKGKVAELKKKT